MKKHPTDEQIEEVSQLLEKYNRLTKFEKLTSPTNWAYFFLTTPLSEIEKDIEVNKSNDPIYAKFIEAGARVFHSEIMDSTLYKLLKEV